MPLDAGVFDKLKTFQDYQRADQDFQMRKQLAAQQLQSGDIDAASKSNIYATQVLSGAVAGGQPAYDQARQALQQRGIDVSNWAPDVQTGAKQAEAARLAQSPLGSLLNAQLKDQSNQIAAAQALGSTNQTAFPSIVGRAPAIPQAPAAQPVQQDGGGMPTGAIPMAPRSDPALFASTPQITTSTPQGGENLPATLPPADAGITPRPPHPTPAMQRFSPPAQNPGETIAAYNQRAQQAFEAYKADPNYVAAQAAASVTGKDRAEATKDAIGANANFDQVVQTINGIKDLIKSPAGLPQDRYGLPAGGRAWLNQNFGDQKLADNSNAFTKLNEAQTIGAIKELASTGQIRMTRTLENILNRGYLIEPGASPTSKDQQANLILAELNNSKIAAQNVDAGLSGGQAAPYQQMPAAAAPTQGGVVSYKDYFK